jgi:tetraacyldisaccharide 4'-kinase
MHSWAAMRPPDFWTRTDFAARLIVALLSPLGWLYGASVAYRAQHAQPYQAAARVICVGNLTAGGTGKTPIAIALARMLIERGARPVFLSRGYGGKVRGPAFVTADDRATHVGDEPLLLAAVAPVIVSADRAAGAKLAEEHGFDVVIMDDGHQNFALHKDLSLVVVDAEAGFGNGRVLPAGPLREPVRQGLKRADAVIVNGEGAPPLDGFAGPVVHAGLVEQADVVQPGMAVVAFAGIGRPAKFFASLARLGARIVEQRAYGDHHVYTQAELARLKAKARAEDALLITTQKDFVRLTPTEREGIAALAVQTRFAEPEVLGGLLDRLRSPAVPPKAS